MIEVREILISDGSGTRNLESLGGKTVATLVDTLLFIA